jgi:hypothetical protein
MWLDVCFIYNKAQHRIEIDIFESYLCAKDLVRRNRQKMSWQALIEKKATPPTFFYFMWGARAAGEETLEHTPHFSKIVNKIPNF